ncbi:MAG: 4-hydroxy-tetrahydrodipicolinate synthase [Clostridia bacterium]|nr:4-hydroxy-tetrahydrodipicolinate synthase [Clostridia bacterium]MBO5416026.1 4-hydroxy-tetrahydrodipicolinate synthase [Clostridia bacterium]
MKTKTEIFTGMATALVTPFSSGRVDYEAYGRLIEYQLNGGADALCVLGTTGESATVSLRERKSIIACAKERVNKKVPILVGTGSNYTERTLKMTVEAEKMGADACLVVTPYYNKTSEDGLIKHYKKVAGSVDIPIILYDVPSRTGMKISRSVLRALSEVENIVAIKQANPDLTEVGKQMAEFYGRYDFYSGNDELTLPLLSLGARGVISAVGNIIPNEISTLCHAFFANDISKARRLQHSVAPLVEEMFAEVSPIPLKCALSKMGLCKNELRLPLAPSTREKEIERIILDFIKN